MRLRDGLASDAEAARPVDPEGGVVVRRSRRLSWLRAAIGIVLGLAVTEAAFRHRDGGAFPLVNVFAPDDQRGVRLEPSTTTRVGTPEGRVTTVRTNAHGYRGPEWPPPSGSDLLVVGDSQSFGLGVEEGEAFPRVLEGQLSRSVLDASVPTYGPPEYELTIERVLGERSPRTIVVALNLLNDWDELDRPNRERHTAFDGWAVRTSALGEGDRSSPLVELAIRESHAAFALWRWERTTASGPADLAPRSDLHTLANRVLLEEQAIAADTEARELARQGEVDDARRELDDSRAAVVALAKKYQGLVAYSGRTEREWRAYLETSGEPHDERFTLDYGGCGRPLDGQSTYDLQLSAKEIKGDVETMLRSFATLPSYGRGEAAAIRDAFARREAAEARVKRAPPPVPPPEGAHPARPMTEWLSRVQALSPEARIVVVALPLDVQVAEEARSLRGASAAEVGALDRLVTDVVRESSMRGMIGVDPTSRLREIGSGAYLADGHLGARGHEAVASAIADALTKGT